MTNIRNVKDYVVIIRCIHERGQSQLDALIELRHRRLWLSPEQAVTAGLTREQAGLGAER